MTDSSHNKVAAHVSCSDHAKSASSAAPVCGQRPLEQSRENASSLLALDPVVLFHEIAERLTAIGNYLEAADSMLTSKTRAAEEMLGEIIKKALEQYSVAIEPVRQLREEIIRVRAAQDRDI